MQLTIEQMHRTIEEKEIKIKQHKAELDEAQKRIEKLEEQRSVIFLYLFLLFFA